MYKELYRMVIFARVVQSGSFSTAAKKMGLGKSVVSQHIRALEDRIGVRLINRNTRALSLTDDGEDFYRHCQAIIETADVAFDSVKPTPDVRGTIRIAASHNLGLAFVVGLVHRFRGKYQGIDVDLSLDDEIVNLIQQQIDIAIRVGPLNDSRHHVVKLCGYELIMCVGRDFPRSRLPKKPEDLTSLPWIEIPRASIGQRLVLTKRNGAKKTVKFHATIRTNSGIAAQAFIKSGEGVGILPNYAIREDIEKGELIRVLPDWRLPPNNISAVFASNQLPPRSRLFLDFAKSEFKSAFDK